MLHGRVRRARRRRGSSSRRRGRGRRRDGPAARATDAAVAAREPALEAVQLLAQPRILQLQRARACSTWCRGMRKQQRLSLLS